MMTKRLMPAYSIWFGAVLFYLYQYIIRVSPGVMKDDLMEAFGITASGFSSLSSFALYFYAFMQIPIGIMVDHYGTRRTVLSSIVLCLSGVALFAFSEQLVFGYLARMMMGAGSACAFLSVSKIINEWFPDTHKGVMMGMTAALGTLGAYLGLEPLVMLIENQGWRMSLFILAGIGALVLALNAFLLPHHPQAREKAVPGEETTPFRSLVSVFKNGQAWLYGLVAVGIYLSIAVIADLWGVSFAEEKFDLAKSEAANIIFYIYFGTAVGCPLFGWVSQAIGSVKQTIVMGGLVLIGLLAYVVFVPDIPVWFAKVLFFGIGLSTGAEILCFIASCSLMGPQVAGTMTGFLNCIVSLSAAIIQQHIGFVLDYFWDGSLAASGIREYSVGTYQIAYSIILFFTAVSVALAFFIKSQKSGKVKPV